VHAVERTLGALRVPVRARTLTDPAGRCNVP